MGPRPVGHGEDVMENESVKRFVASMGPRPVGHGERENMNSERMGIGSCFNGATASRPWREHDLRPLCSNMYSFNGATASRPWREYGVVGH